MKDRVMSYMLKDTTSAELGNKDFTGNLAWYFPLETDKLIVVRKEQNQFFGPDSPSSNTAHSVGCHSFHSPCNSLASDVELTASVLWRERQNAWTVIEASLDTTRISLKLESSKASEQYPHAKDFTLGIVESVLKAA
jgi:hypothetical protein